MICTTDGNDFGGPPNPIPNPNPAPFRAREVGMSVATIDRGGCGWVVGAESDAGRSGRRRKAREGAYFVPRPTPSLPPPMPPPMPARWPPVSWPPSRVGVRLFFGRRGKEAPRGRARIRPQFGMATLRLTGSANAPRPSFSDATPAFGAARALRCDLAGGPPSLFLSLELSLFQRAPGS